MDAAREAAKAKAAAEAEPDEGGWVTVSRHSGKAKRKPLGLGTKTGQAKIKARDAKRRKRKEMLDFYKFQVWPRSKRDIFLLYPLLQFTDGVIYSPRVYVVNNFKSFIGSLLSSSLAKP